MKNSNVDKFFDTIEFNNSLFKKWGELYKAEESLLSALIDRRKALGYSQKDLGDLIDLRQSAVARLESGANSPQLHTILKLVDALKLKFELKPIEETPLQQSTYIVINVPQIQNYDLLLSQSNIYQTSKGGYEDDSFQYKLASNKINFSQTSN